MIFLLNVSKLLIHNIWTGFYQDKNYDFKNDFFQYNSYIDSNSENNLFHRLPNICTI